MNILHHKSWHVRTKKNIEKVRNDEKKDLESQLEKARKADVSEHERRIKELRDKFNKNDEKTNQNNNLNLFKNNYDIANNKASILEKKLEQEEWEKKVGILTSLGKASDKDLPWYEKDPDKITQKLNYKDVYHIEYQDPLKKIQKDLKKNFPNEEKLKNNFNRYNMRKEINLKKTKKKEKIEEDPKAQQLKVLREKRLKREKKNSERVKMLFSNTSVFPSGDRDRNYTNQFNPHLAKK